MEANDQWMKNKIESCGFRIIHFLSPYSNFGGSGTDTELLLPVSSPNGRHRSVSMATELECWLAQRNVDVAVKHMRSFHE